MLKSDSARLRDGAGLVRVQVVYKQRVVEREITGGAPTLRQWRGAEGEWLRGAVAARRAQGESGWVEITRRAFRAGVGAEGRKTIERYAVAPEGNEVHRIARLHRRSDHGA